MWRRTNTGVSRSDFTPFTVFSPIDGSPITYYNVSAAKAAQLSTNLVDTNAPDRTDKYNGFEYNFNIRLPHHITLFGGGMSERILSNSCDDDWNPNLLLYCDQSKSGVPFRTQFKSPVRCRSRTAFRSSLAFQSLPGYLYGTSSVGSLTGVSGPSGAPGRRNSPTPAARGRVLLVTSTSTYASCPGSSAAAGCVVGAKIDPGLTVASLSIPLVAPMTEYGDRINQLDLNVARTFKLGSGDVQPKIDFFNLLNRAPVTAVLGLNYGTAAYNQPSVVLNPRTVQLGAVDQILGSSPRARRAPSGARSCSSQRRTWNRPPLLCTIDLCSCCRFSPFSCRRSRVRRLMRCRLRLAPKPSSFIFTSTDCPISNRYAPEVRRIADAFAAKGVVFRLVYPNPSEDATAIRAAHGAYAYPAASSRCAIRSRRW